MSRSRPLAFAAAAALLLLGCSDRSETLLARARELQAEGEFAPSIAPLREALEHRPDDLEAEYLLGVALARQGEWSSAVWRLWRAAQSGPHAVPAGLLLATAFLATQNVEEAIPAVDRVLALEPDNVAALELRARAQLARGAAEEALADAERALAVDADHLGALSLRVSALGALERFEEAEAAMARLEERSADLEPALRTRLCTGRVDLKRGQGNAEAAEAQLRSCLAAAPADLFLVQYAASWFDELERPEEGDRVLREALAEEPRAFGLSVQLAERMRVRGEGDAAEALLVEAAERDGSALALGALADFQRRRGDAQAARATFERALAATEGDAEPLRFRYADVLVDLDDLAAAEAVLAQLTLPVHATLIRGRIFLGRGDARAALAAFESGIRLWPNNPGARFLAGVAAERLGDFERAASEYREAVRVDDAATDAGLALARLRHALGDEHGAFEFAGHHLRGHPDDPRGYVIAAQAAAALGRHDLARATLAALSRFDPLLAAIENAALEREAGGPAAAERALEKSGLDLSAPANHAALRALAQTLVDQSRSREALARAAAASSAHPNSPDLHDLRGRLLQRMGREADARAAFERALSLDAEHAPALEGLATLAFHSGDADAAVALLDRAAAADPEGDHAYAAAQIVVAKQGADARRRLEAIVAERPLHGRAANDLAWLLAHEDADLEQALRLAERATALDPGPSSWDTLGWVRLRRGELDLAQESLERALAAQGSAPGTRYRLGLVRSARGDTQGAARDFRAALEGGDFPEAQDARARLAELSQAGIQG